MSEPISRSTIPDPSNGHSDPFSEKVEANLYSLFSAPKPPAQLKGTIDRAITNAFAQRSQHRSPFRLNILRAHKRVAIVVALLTVGLVSATVYALPTLISRAFTDPLNLDPGMQQVQASQLVKPINQTLTNQGITVTLDGAYADANRVIVGYTIQYPSGYEWDGMQYENDLVLATDNGTLLPWKDYGAAMEMENGKYAVVPSFDASAVMDSPTEIHLQLKIQLRAIKQVAADKGVVIAPEPFVFNFTTAFTPARVAELNQTVVVHNVPITLQKVVFTPSETRLYVRFQETDGLPASSWTEDGTLNLAADNWQLVNQTNYQFAHARTRDGEFYPLPFALNGKHGEWTLTIAKIASYPDEAHSVMTKQLTGPWVFHFTVP
jgi:Domain of unknown function (DUF4179)